jgi:hypothetical protein
MGVRPLPVDCLREHQLARGWRGPTAPSQVGQNQDKSFPAILQLRYIYIYSAFVSQRTRPRQIYQALPVSTARRIHLIER